MKNFSLIGAAGFIAPRHMRAIRDTGNQMVAALDPSDSVGIIDSYFPEADFFTEFERFDRHIEKLRRHKGKSMDYISICSPNYLHDAHVRFALRVGAHAICEKPLVLNPWNLDDLEKLSSEMGRRIYTILQLRLHPSILAFRDKILRNGGGRKHDVDLTYITARGHWYLYSWKGKVSESGGLATNIGVHFFDMLAWCFGRPVSNVVHLSTPRKAAGFLELENARVRWFLSIDRRDLPRQPMPGQLATFRSLQIDGEEIEFSDGFGELHTKSYQEILAGRGFEAAEARDSIEIVHDIRHAVPLGAKGDCHPLAAEVVRQKILV
ncbi:MAG: Gfo/Idh/MocA family oxidoreductase [Elusimicrobia bacterium]|nr:Gfo/Idh/MocA family oxidoreductase [Elusimicrobiota bacterium]